MTHACSITSLHWRSVSVYYGQSTSPSAIRPLVALRRCSTVRVFVRAHADQEADGGGDDAQKADGCTSKKYGLPIRSSVSIWACTTHQGGPNLRADVFPLTCTADPTRRPTTLVFARSAFTHVTRLARLQTRLALPVSRASVRGRYAGVSGRVADRVANDLRERSDGRRISAH